MLRRLRQNLPKRFFKLRWAFGSVLFVACLALFALVLTVGISSAKAQSPSPRSTPPTPAQIDRFLPAPRLHPLPASLARWQTRSSSDYFDQVQPTIAGYPVWSRFPVRIYLEHTTQLPDRSQEWINAVTAAIQDWNAYLPLTIVNTPDTADITIWRRTPPLQVDRLAATHLQVDRLAATRRTTAQSDRSPNRQPDLRARSAETRFNLWVDRTIPEQPVLSHRMTIWLGMGQTQDYLRAAARHELGHAIGIWGHSPTATDVMYFAQVRQPPPISDRDINTLRRIYQQPTRLGWAIPQSD